MSIICELSRAGEKRSDIKREPLVSRPSSQSICTVRMLRAELKNATLYGGRGEKSLGWWGRNSGGTLAYNWF